MNRMEKRAWERLRPFINTQRGMGSERVENLAGTGTPDVNVFGLCVATVQVELKAREAPRRASTPLLALSNYKTSQLNWHAAAARTLSKTFVLCGLQGEKRAWEWWLFGSRYIRSSYVLPREEFAVLCISRTRNLDSLFELWRMHLGGKWK